VVFHESPGNKCEHWDAEYRPGDKWAASVLAISPKDGKIKWGFQYTPNDPYGMRRFSFGPQAERASTEVSCKLHGGFSRSQTPLKRFGIQRS
jgi:hypothetical protein